MKEKTVPAGCAPSFVVSKFWIIVTKTNCWPIDNIRSKKSTELTFLYLVEKWPQLFNFGDSFGPLLGSSFKGTTYIWAKISRILSFKSTFWWVIKRNILIISQNPYCQFLRNMFSMISKKIWDNKWCFTPYRHAFWYEKMKKKAKISIFELSKTVVPMFFLTFFMLNR